MHHARLASLADLPLLVPLFDAYRQFYGRASDRALAERFLHERLSQGDAVLLLALSSAGQGLGLAQLFPSFSSVAAARIFVLNDLFVTPEARRRGVGRMLLGLAEDEARRRGALRMTLSTQHANMHAQALYRSAGWQRDEAFAVYHRVLQG